MDHFEIVKNSVNSLIKSDHATNKIARLSGVPTSSISRLRSRERLLKNVTFDSIERLYNCSKKLDI